MGFHGQDLASSSAFAALLPIETSLSLTEVHPVRSNLEDHWENSKAELAKDILQEEIKREGTHLSRGQCEKERTNEIPLSHITATCMVISWSSLGTLSCFDDPAISTTNPINP